MRNLLKIIIVLFMICNLNLVAQINEYTNTLNGHVNKVIIYTPYSTSIVHHYDKRGFLKSECLYNGITLEDDSLFSKDKFSYTFDHKDRISEIFLVDIHRDKHKKVFTYRPSYYIIKDYEKENGKWVSSYNGTIKYTYNDQEYKTIEIFEYGLFHEYYKWNKDKTQLLEMRFETEEDGWDEYVCKYTYNDQGLLIYEEYQTKIDSISDLQFGIDSLGNIGHTYIFRSTESESYNTEYEYDKYNNCIQEKMIYHDGSICIKSYVYEYDKEGNWISKKEYIGDVLNSHFLRKIIYFN